MEITNGMKRYWRRKRYQRIDGAITKKKSMQMARLGGKRKRTWRIRVMPKLKLGFKCMSPLKMLARLRDGYIRMMVGLEGKVGALNGNNFFGAKKLNPKADKSRKVSKAEEFEAKLIFEIYKSLMASRQLVSQNSIKV